MTSKEIWNEIKTLVEAQPDKRIVWWDQDSDPDYTAVIAKNTMPFLCTEWDFLIADDFDYYVASIQVVGDKLKATLAFCWKPNEDGSMPHGEMTYIDSGWASDIICSDITRLRLLDIVQEYAKTDTNDKG